MNATFNCFANIFIKICLYNNLLDRGKRRCVTFFALIASFFYKISSYLFDFFSSFCIALNKSSIKSPYDKQWDKRTERRTWVWTWQEQHSFCSSEWNIRYEPQFALLRMQLSRTYDDANVDNIRFLRTVYSCCYIYLYVCSFECRVNWAAQPKPNIIIKSCMNHKILFLLLLVVNVQRHILMQWHCLVLMNKHLMDQAMMLLKLCIKWRRWLIRMLFIVSLCLYVRFIVWSLNDHVGNYVPRAMTIVTQQQTKQINIQHNWAIVLWMPLTCQKEKLNFWSPFAGRKLSEQNADH